MGNDRPTRTETHGGIAGDQRLIRRGPTENLAPEPMVKRVAGPKAVSPGALQTQVQNSTETDGVPCDQGVLFRPGGGVGRQRDRGVPIAGKDRAPGLTRPSAPQKCFGNSFQRRSFSSGITSICRKFI